LPRVLTSCFFLFTSCFAAKPRSCTFLSSLVSFHSAGGGPSPQTKGIMFSGATTPKEASG
jgi:hypothetical protein